jgi:hypothetical protein
VADVSPFPPGRGGDGSDGSGARSRGQLFLVGALALAVVFVALALVLNTSIYAENLATRESEIAGANDALQHREDVARNAGEVIRHVNRNASQVSFGTREGYYDANLTEWGRRSAAFQATQGSLSSVAPEPARRGVLLADDDPAAAFTDRTGAETWVAATDVKLRDLQFTVEKSSLAECEDSEVESLLGLVGGCDAFYLSVDGPGGEYRIAFYRDEDLASENVEVKVHDVGAGTFATCTADGSTVAVDVTGAYLDGDRCRALDAVDTGNTATVEFHNALDGGGGANALGTYRMVFDRLESVYRAQVDRANFGSRCAADTTFADPTAGTPYTIDAVYAANATVRYRSSGLTYSTEVRAAPGERGEPPAKPYFDSFSVTDGAADDGTVEVSWTVADPKPGATGATVDLDVDNGGTDVFDGTGLPPSDTVTVSDGGYTAGDTLTVEVVVHDGEGNTRSIVQDHVDDGATCP